jgi:hypothetical protein
MVDTAVYATAARPGQARLAGKPKLDGSRGSQSYISRGLSLPEGSNISAIAYTPPSTNIGDEHSSSYRPDADWSPTTGPADGRMNGYSESSVVIPTPNDVTLTEVENPGTNTEPFDPSFVWMNTPRTDIASHSSVITPLAPYFEYETDFNISSGPGLGPEPNFYLSNTIAKSPTCNCFNTCLQALQALHNNCSAATSVPPFDVVLTVNRKAVDGCAMMLNCPICLSQSGSSITTMLLGTIIGKIMAIYQDASKNYFGLTTGLGSQAQPLPVTFGTYRVAGDDGRWLEMEIIMRELKKLKVLFAKFQETTRTNEWEEAAGMHSAVTNYLCQSLHLTFEVLNMQKNNAYG